MKDKKVIFTRVLFVLFLITTIISLFIAYQDINSIFAYRFVIGYLCFTVFLIVYIFINTFLQLRKLKRNVIRKRLLKFIILFVIIFGSLICFDFIFRPSQIDIYKGLFIALGSSFSISFLDIIIIHNK
jgi:hypothetical protein